jgi:PAS domain S-box-containing protein
MEKGRKAPAEGIIQRKNGELSLAEHEQLLQTVFNKCPVALVVARLADSQVVDVNEAFVATSGFEKAEVLGRSFQELQIWANPADRDSVLERLTQYRQVRDLEFRFRMKNGSLRVFLLSANIVQINGEDHILASARDVTELRRSDQALRQSEERLRAVVENLPVGVWFTDEKGQIVYGNPAGRKIWSGARYVGPDQFHEYKAWWAGMGIALGPDDWAVTRAIRKGETSLNEVLQIECFDGTRKTILNSAVPMRDPAGHIIGTVVLNEDITERKQAEEFLKNSHDTLEAWVDERTQQLLASNERLKSEVEERLRTEQSLMKHQWQLRKLSSALVQTEERERRRISTAIHDGIGQTLAATKIKLGAIRSSLPSGELPGQLDEVRDLISSAIQETRTLTFELSLPVLYEIGLKPALEWMAEQYQRKYGLPVMINGDGCAESLDVPDRVFLFQAIRELCFNVVKHAQATHARVSIHGEGGSGVIRCEVVDDGAGFDVKKDAQTAGAEMGFGLFRIREQLRQCGGSLTLETNPGSGTRVVLRLPLNVLKKLQGGADEEDPGASGG